MRLVDTTESRELFLENVSGIIIFLIYCHHYSLSLLDCDIFYQLYYKIDVIPDTGSVNQERISSPLIPILNGKADSNSQNIIFNDNSNGDHCLFCTYPSGTINARSQLRNTFTFHPPLAGLFELFIYAKVRVNNAKNNSSMMSNEEVALLRISQENRESSFFNNEDDVNRISSLSNTPLTATITSRSAYPTIIFDDVRVDGNNINAIFIIIILIITTTRL